MYLVNEELRASNRNLEGLQAAIPGALLVVDAFGVIQRVNYGTLALLGYAEDTLSGSDASVVLPEGGATASLVGVCAVGEHPARFEDNWMTASGAQIPVLVSWTTHRDAFSEDLEWLVCVGVDLRERKRLEDERRHAQKLESVGQLAAGIAHEINTPMQFIGDNVQFLSEVFEDLLGAVDAYEAFRESCPSAPPRASRDLEEALEDADLDYIRERAPGAFARALEGIERVSRIVAAMKTLSHPSTEEAPEDLNRAVETALVVSQNEYKYVADAVRDLGDIPPVRCRGGDISQVLLNLVVNAAHAIAAVNARTHERGRITVRTRRAGDFVEIAVEDTGSGIPEAVRHRIFDPFFTTKEVGKGTGQGLSLAHAIVDRHRGSLTFDTRPGDGTTFYVRLPIDGVASAQEKAA